MKKFKIKSVLNMLLFSICLSLIISSPASASNLYEDNHQMLYDSYEDRYMLSVIMVENGIPRKLTQNEYDEILAKRERIENIKKSLFVENELSTLKTYSNNEIQPQSYSVHYSFDKWGEDDWHPRSMTMRVSPRVYARYADDDMGYTVANSVNVSIGGSFGGGATIRKIISSQFTIEFSSSTEKTESFEIDGTVPKGHTGWVEFTPRMANIWGKLTKTEYTNYNVIETHSYSDSFFPTTIGEFADGIYEVTIVEGEIR